MTDAFPFLAKPQRVPGCLAAITGFRIEAVSDPVQQTVVRYAMNPHSPNAAFIPN
ncbi:MAG: hypothetical protein LBG69_09815 [Zoogloeaceae bacterium]|nr:hypothetical protein [Zoogloeaceae bacterium]